MRLRCAADELEVLAQSEPAEPHRDQRRELVVLGRLVSFADAAPIASDDDALDPGDLLIGH